ncbi:MAG: peptidylprolyl isomerase [Candidatus Nanoarchaeia archaeon]|nr:peptidylprolyl isomerase [Candidatus Nanoarchaeia archaeon]
MKTKKDDFVEIDFVARVKDTNEIFDLTREEIAKKEKISKRGMTFKPWVVCLGHGDVLPGLDKGLVDKEVGKEYNFVLKPEEGFGLRSKELLQLVNTEKFRKNEVMPVPGMQFNVDNMIGTVKSVSGSRTLIDFNHPLAGKELVYDVRINKIIENEEEKVKEFFDFHFHVSVEVEKKEDKLVVKGKIQEPVKKIAKEILERLLKKKIEYVM